jgi:hypothetical protein
MLVGPLLSLGGKVNSLKLVGCAYYHHYDTSYLAVPPPFVITELSRMLMAIPRVHTLEALALELRIHCAALVSDIGKVDTTPLEELIGSEHLRMIQHLTVVVIHNDWKAHILELEDDKVIEMFSFLHQKGLLRVEHDIQGPGPFLSSLKATLMTLKMEFSGEWFY